MAGSCPYELIRLLRAGTTVSVHEAFDGPTPVVVKTLQAETTPADPVGKSRFAREIALAVGGRHPGLAKVHAHGRNWVAFERLEHFRLSSNRGNALSVCSYAIPGAKPLRTFAGIALEPPGDRLTKPGGLRRLVAQLAATLAYLHARGVVHRDVKPAHVMFRGEQPVLIDLGVAGLVTDDPLEGKELVGSPAWMAPEQILGAKPAPSADIWSLCAVGASIAQGAPLFHGTADAVLAERRGTVQTEVRLAGLLDDQRLVTLLEAGFGPAQDRPTAAEMARELLSYEE